MMRVSKIQGLVAGLLVFGASAGPALAADGLGGLLADMTPMQPAGAAPPGAPMQGGMMEGQMGMPPASGGQTMAAPPPAPMQGGMMGMPSQGAAGAAAPMPGMQAPNGMPMSPAGMPGAGNAMTPMSPGMMRMMQTMMGQMAGMQTPPAAPLDHLEGRIAFIKAELGISEAQAQAWDQFAQALRTSRDHLGQARQALLISMGTQSSVPDRLQAYERHLSMRLDSLRTAREAFQRLYTLLNPAQKQTADELVAPLLASF